MELKNHKLKIQENQFSTLHLFLCFISFHSLLCELQCDITYMSKSEYGQYLYCNVRAVLAVI